MRWSWNAHHLLSKLTSKLLNETRPKRIWFKLDLRSRAQSDPNRNPQTGIGASESFHRSDGGHSFARRASASRRPTGTDNSSRKFKEKEHKRDAPLCVRTALRIANSCSGPRQMETMLYDIITSRPAKPFNTHAHARARTHTHTPLHKPVIYNASLTLI